jgi:hypothetical protein
VSVTVVASGHLIDGPERAEERFPSSAEPDVAAGIRTIFDEWEIGPGDTVLCGGARGSDLLFAEAALERGATVRVVLAMPPERFVEESVHLDDSDWYERFLSVLGDDGCEAEVLEGPAGANPFQAVNHQLVRYSYQAGDDVRGALVWDGKRGLPGGTGEMAALLELCEVPVIVVAPRPGV